MLVAAADERDAVLAEHAEVTDEGLEPPTVARRCDHSFRLDAGVVGEQHVRAIEAGNRRNDLDLPGVEETHEPTVVRRSLLALAHSCREPASASGGRFSSGDIPVLSLELDAADIASGLGSQALAVTTASAVDGSMTAETFDMRSAGKAPQRACSSRMSSSGAT